MISSHTVIMSLENAHMLIRLQNSAHKSVSRWNVDSSFERTNMRVDGVSKNQSSLHHNLDKSIYQLGVRFD